MFKLDYSLCHRNFFNFAHFSASNYNDFWVNPYEYHRLLRIRKLQYAAFVSCDFQNINFPHSFHAIICRYFPGTRTYICNMHCSLNTVCILSQSYSQTHYFLLFTTDSLLSPLPTQSRVGARVIISIFLLRNNFLKPTALHSLDNQNKIATIQLSPSLLQISHAACSISFVEQQISYRVFVTLLRTVEV